MKKISFLMIFALLFAMNIYAQEKDKEGSRDYPGISRYKGAVIHEYQEINYTNFYFGLDEPVMRDFNGHGQFFKKYIEVRGKLFNIQYVIPATEGVLKVYENYKNALTLAGYTFLYIEQNKNSCFYREDLYGGDGGALAKNPRSYYSPDCDKDYYYVVAKGVKDSLDIYVSLYITTSGSDKIIVNQSVVEAVPLELGLVKADNIATNLEVMGHCIFYDIHFATGSAEIDSKSDNQIKEIADFLKTNPDKKYYIVGHTDNTGSFEANMTLSESRAKAVMNTLINKYGVNSDQLKAYGVASLCPVASNKDDAGKARNRRVEIVEQ